MMFSKRVWAEYGKLLVTDGYEDVESFVRSHTDSSTESSEEDDASSSDDSDDDNNKGIDEVFAKFGEVHQRRIKRWKEGQEIGNKEVTPDQGEKEVYDWLNKELEIPADSSEEYKVLFISNGFDCKNSIENDLTSHDLKKMKAIKKGHQTKIKTYIRRLRRTKRKNAKETKSPK